MCLLPSRLLVLPAFSVYQNPMDYLDFGKSLIASHPKHRTISGDFGGKRIWVKQSVPPKARIWHTLQRFLAWVIGMPILRSTVSPGGHRALEAEASRLREFKAKGFHVPTVLAMHQDMMVLEDSGPSFRAWLDNTQDESQRTQALKAAILALAALHEKSLAHGRPYMRDMTWDGQTIGFLDLEENPAGVMNFYTAQARDVWIFLSAASRYAREPGNKMIYHPELIETLFETYRAKASLFVIEELDNFVTAIGWLANILEKEFWWRRIGTDARQSVFVTKCLQKSLKKQA